MGICTRITIITGPNPMEASNFFQALIGLMHIYMYIRLDIFTPMPGCQSVNLQQSHQCFPKEAKLKRIAT